MVLIQGVVDTRPLHYGDEIILSELSSQALLRSSPGIGSYVYADELAFDVPGRGSASTPGIHECAFQICVHQAHRAQDEFAKSLAINNLRPDTWSKELGPASPIFPGISVLAHEAEKEAKTNEHRRISSLGQGIAYGDKVQLHHSWSGAILTATREPSEQEPRGMLIQLVQRMDEGAWFTVLSPGKALQNGDAVRNNAEIILESARYPGRYLSLNISSASLDSQVAIEASLLPHPYIHRRLECFLGSRRQTLAVRVFKKQAASAISLPAPQGTHTEHAVEPLAVGSLHVAGGSRAPPLQERWIVGTDIVQLYHREDDAMLVVETETHAAADLTSDHAPPERGVAFFMPLEGKQQDPGAKSLFFVQHLKVEDGGKHVTPKDVILLQHLVTGLYLCWEAEGSQLSATSDYLGRVRTRGSKFVPPPPDLHHRSHLAHGYDNNHQHGYDPSAEPPGSPRSPGAVQSPMSPARAAGTRRDAYDGAGNPCEMLLLHIDTTSGALQVPVGSAASRAISVSSVVYLTHRDRGSSFGDESAGSEEDEGLHRRLFLSKSTELSKLGTKQLCAAAATRAPSPARCLLEVRTSNMRLARSVLDISCAVTVMNGLVSNIARAAPLELPRDRNGDVDMLVRDEFVLAHATTGLILNSVLLLDHLVDNLLVWLRADDSTHFDPDGEGEGDIGREELGRADFRGGVGGARGAGSRGTAGGAGWGDVRKNAGKGTQMQHLIRQHGGVEAVCKLVHVVFVYAGLPLDLVDRCVLGEGLLELARKSYRFIAAAMRDNHANRHICVQFVRTFQQHLTADFLAVECLFELFRGPPDILCMLREDFFTNGIKLLRATRSPAMVMLLSSCCVAGDGSAVRENQARVLKLVFEQQPDLFCKVRHSLPTLESDPFTANIHFSDRLGGVTDEVSALDLRDINDDLLHDYRAAGDELVALFQYYLATLELMCAVAHDRYWPASEHLMLNSFNLACGYNDLLFLIKHEMCPWILRAHACNLMTALYVDRAPFLELDPTNQVRTWTKLHESVADEHVRQQQPYAFLPEKLRPPEGFRELKEHCLTQLDKCSNVDMENTGQTVFAQRLTDLCLRMARLGAYHSYEDHLRVMAPFYDDIRPLSSLLIGMLDGRTDRICFVEGMEAPADAGGGLAESSRSEQAALERLRVGIHVATQTVRDLKVTICDLLLFFWRCRDDDRVSRFLEKLEQVIEDDVGPALFASVTRGTEKRKAAAEFTAVVPDDQAAESPRGKGMRKGGKVIPEEEPQDELALPLAYANDVEKFGQEKRPLWPQQVVKDLVQTLFRNDEYGREVIEVRALREPEGSLSIVSRVLLDLALYEDPRLSRRAFQLLMRQLGQRHDFLRQVAGVHFIVRPRSARAFFKTRADVIELRYAMPWVHRDDVARRAEALLMSQRVLNKWTQALRGHGAAHGREAKEEADTDEGELRRILFQLRAHEYVMELLLLPMRRVFSKKEGELDVAVDKERQELFVKCHQFVAALCTNHRTVQEFFFAHRRVLQAHLGIVGLPVAETLTEMVTGHERLVHGAGEEYIRTLFGAIRHYRSKRPAWLRAVRAMVVVRNVPVKHHQNVVLEYLAERSDEFASLMLTPSEWNLRIDMVLEGELGAAHLTTSRLDFHLVCIHLLADCAMGHNPAAEVQVAALLSWDDIMDVLLDLNTRSRGASGVVEPLPSVAVRTIRSAFVRVLYHVYVKTKMAHPHEQVRRPDNRLWEASRVEPPRTATTSHPSATSSAAASTAGSDSVTQKTKRRLPAPGFFTCVVHEVQELGRLLEHAALGKVIKQPKDFAALKELVLADLLPMITEYYKSFYEVGCSGSQQDALVSEELFDAFDKLVTAGHLPAEHVKAVEAVVAAIGNKVDSRGNRRKLLEFTLAANAAPARGSFKAAPMTSPSGKMDAPSLLRDLMATSARAFKLQVAELSLVEIADGIPLAGGLGALARLCLLDKDVPLHAEKKFGDDGLLSVAQRNPQYKDIGARLASWVRSRKAGCGPQDAVLLEEAGSLLAALVYLDDPLDASPRDRKSLRTCWDRLRRAQVPAPLNVPQLESLRAVQDKYLGLGYLESCAILLSRDDKALHAGALVCLNALLARECRPAQARLHSFLVSAGGEGSGGEQAPLAFGARGEALMRNLSDILEGAGGTLKRYKRLLKYQLAFPSTLHGAAGDDSVHLASITQSAGMGWGSAGHGRQVLPEKGSIAYQEWAVTGQGGGGGGGGPSGNPTPASERALVEEQEAMGSGSLLALAIRAVDNMCRGGCVMLQLALAAKLPPPPPPPEEAKVQETEMSKQARKNLLASAPPRSILEALTLLLQRLVPCLELAVRYQDCTVLDLGKLVLDCFASSVDGLCEQNQTLLIRARVPALLQRIINLSYRSLETSGTGPQPRSHLASSPPQEEGAGRDKASSLSSPGMMMAVKANLSLAALKVAAGHLLHLLVLGCSEQQAHLKGGGGAPEDAGGARASTRGGLGSALGLLEKQVDCEAVARQAAVNASLLGLAHGVETTTASPVARLLGFAGMAEAGSAQQAPDVRHVELDMEDIGLDSSRGRDLLQEEMLNYMLLLRALETEVEATTRLTHSGVPSGGALSLVAGIWYGPSQALARISVQAPRLWHFASQRLRCVEIVTTPAHVKDARFKQDLARAKGHGTLGASGADVGREHGTEGRRLVLWFALSDYLSEWNAGGGTRRAAELTWEALHENGGRGGVLTHGAALLRCWDESCRRFFTWRSLRGATALVGGLVPGAPPEHLQGLPAHSGVSSPTSAAAERQTSPGPGAGRRDGSRSPVGSPVRGAKSPASKASSRASKVGHRDRKRTAAVRGVGSVGGRSLAEMLEWSEGAPCVLSLLVMLIFTAAYGVPSEHGPAQGGGNGALHEGQYNVTKEVIAWGLAAATAKFPSGPRWGAPAQVPAELGSYDPWRFAPWSQLLLRALAALHVVATACEIASWLLNRWPTVFLRVAAEQRLRQRRAAAGEHARAHAVERGRRSKGSKGDASKGVAMDVGVVDAQMLGRLLRASVVPYFLLVLGIFSLLGAVHSPLFLLAHNVRLLAPLARAARVAAPKMARTACIALVVLVTYGLFAYAYFSPQLSAVSRKCFSPWQCVSTFVLAALARDNDVLAHDADDWAETPPLFAASSWEQFRSLYAASFLIVWGLLLQGALFAHILDAFAQVRQLDEQREHDCEKLDLIATTPRPRPSGAGALYAAQKGRQMAAAGREGAGSVGARGLESDPHSPASWVLFLCWATERVRGSRSVLVQDVVDQFVEGNPRFLPLGLAWD